MEQLEEVSVKHPAAPKIYHIVHVDRLESIISDGCLWCDSEIARNPRPGTTIGIPEIKRRRLDSPITCRPDLKVGACVPFYFCPRSVMLYVIHKANSPALEFSEGQDSIVHLEADLCEVVDWAEQHDRRWAFTLSNAGANYFEDRCDLKQLNKIDWDAVMASDWRGKKEGKQAEFLIEKSCPWELIRRVGVHAPRIRDEARAAMRSGGRQPLVEVMPEWYY